MNKKTKRIVCCTIGIGMIILLVLNITYLRGVLGRVVGSVPAKTAITESEKAVQDAYPGYDLTWIHGGYLNPQGNWDDTCYTSDFLVNKESNNLVSATYCENSSTSIWKSNSEVTIAKRAHERKLTLIKALAEDYTALLKKQLDTTLSEGIRTTYRFNVITPFANVEYDKAVPDAITYGMKFDKNLPLEWEYEIVIRDYADTTYDQMIRFVVESITNSGFQFDNYNFILVNEVNEGVYIYDITPEILQNNNIDDLMQQGWSSHGSYIPYGEEVKY